MVSLTTARRAGRESRSMREALVYALGVAVSPAPIASIIVILTSPRALANGASFLAGWALGVASVITLLVVLVDEAGIGDSDRSWIAVPELVLGTAFVGVALLVWIRRRRRREHAVPWLDAVDDLSRARSAGLGFLLAAANPKVDRACARIGALPRRGRRERRIAAPDDRPVLRDRGRRSGSSARPVPPLPGSRAFAPRPPQGVARPARGDDPHRTRARARRGLPPGWPVEPVIGVVPLEGAEHPRFTRVKTPPAEQTPASRR